MLQLFMQSLSGRGVAPAPASETVDVYVFRGQSNCLGRAEAMELPAGYAYLKEPLQDCFIYNATNGRFETLQAGYNSHGFTQAGGSYAGQFGPCVRFSELMRKHTGRPVYIILFALGGTQLYPSGSGSVKDWHPDSHELLDEWISTVRAGLQKLTEMGKRYRVVGDVWWQGESDANNPIRAAAYHANETAMYAYTDEQLPEIAAAKRVVFELFHTSAVGDYSTVNQAKRDRAAADPRTLATIDTSTYALKADNLHANAAGQIRAGEDLFDLIKEGLPPAQS